MTERIIMLIFSIIVYTLSLAYVAACTFLPIPEGSKEIAIGAVGFLYGTGLSSIINYYWGSSRGSAKKTDAMLKDDCDEQSKKI